MRPTIHETIATKIRAYAEHVISSRPRISQAARTSTAPIHNLKGQLQTYPLPKQKRQNGMSLAGSIMGVSPVSPVMAPMGAAQAAAKELLDSILDTIVRIFGLIVLLWWSDFGFLKVLPPTFLCLTLYLFNVQKTMS